MTNKSNSNNNSFNVNSNNSNDNNDNNGSNRGAGDCGRCGRNKCCCSRSAVTKSIGGVDRDDDGLECDGSSCSRDDDDEGQNAAGQSLAATMPEEAFEKDSGCDDWDMCKNKSDMNIVANCGHGQGRSVRSDFVCDLLYSRWKELGLL